MTESANNQFHKERRLVLLSKAHSKSANSYSLFSLDMTWFSILSAAWILIRFYLTSSTKAACASNSLKVLGLSEKFTVNESCSLLYHMFCLFSRPDLCRMTVFRVTLSGDRFETIWEVSKCQQWQNHTRVDEFTYTAAVTDWDGEGVLARHTHTLEIQWFVIWSLFTTVYQQSSTVHTYRHLCRPVGTLLPVLMVKTFQLHFWILPEMEKLHQ